MVFQGEVVVRLHDTTMIRPERPEQNNTTALSSSSSS